MNRQPDITSVSLKGLSVDLSQRPSAKAVRFVVSALSKFDFCKGLHLNLGLSLTVEDNFVM